MHCLLCFNSDGKLQILQGDIDNDTFKTITYVVPELVIPKTKNPAFICSTCLEQITLFNKIKKASLQNCCTLKHYNVLLKGTNNIKYNELNIKIITERISTQHNVEFKMNPNSKDLLLLKDEDSVEIKQEVEEYDHSNQQLVKEELSIDDLQDDRSNSSSIDGTKEYNKLGAYEFVDINKFNEEDTTLPSSDDKEKTQRQESQFPCNHCNKTFNRRINLEMHTRLHTGERPYHCPICEKTFTQLAHVNSHKLTHTNKKSHECEVCHKTFRFKCNLISHKPIHSFERPFQCSECSKTFTEADQLGEHLITHSRKRRYSCNVCQNKFTRSSDLKRHTRIHTGEKPYSCKYCVKSFKTKSQVNDHARRLHSNEDSK